MPRFFVENASAEPGEVISITGGDARHISGSLRMKPGEKLTVCGGAGYDCLCTIQSADSDEVLLRVDERVQSQTEPSVRVTLYQGYPKGDKLETVIEKSVKLGVYSVVPVLTERSVARPDGKSAERKQERWQRHALEAAKQCGRGMIPQVAQLVGFDALEKLFERHDKVIYFYELGGSPISAIVGDGCRDVGIFIGPEGGISAAEAEKLERWGAVPATLGKRILRTETAPIAALAAIMLLTGNLE